LGAVANGGEGGLFLFSDFVLIFFTLLLVGRRRLGRGGGAPVGKVGSMTSFLVRVRDSKMRDNDNLFWASGSAFTAAKARLVLVDAVPTGLPRLSLFLPFNQRLSETAWLTLPSHNIRCTLGSLAQREPSCCLKLSS